VKAKCQSKLEALEFLRKGEWGEGDWEWELGGVMVCGNGKVEGTDGC